MLYAAEHYKLESQRALDTAKRAATFNKRVRANVTFHQPISVRDVA